MILNNIKLGYCIVLFSMFLPQLKASTASVLPDNKAISWADSVLNTLSTRQKIAQLLMIHAYSDYKPDKIRELELAVKNDGIGGILFMQGGPLRQKEMTKKLRNLSAIPLFIAQDAEWGPAMRLDSMPLLPKALVLGSIKNKNTIYEVGKNIGLQCRWLGVNMNFAPVLDVNSNPDNPVIGVRSFGELPGMVAEKGWIMAKGITDAGVIAVAKHFPGHGNTSVDSHFSLPIISDNGNNLFGKQTLPFSVAVNRGMPGIMTGHLEVPTLDATGSPASVSLPIAQMLRNDLGFKGLLVSDALNMKGVDGRIDQLYKKAFLAGNDILLFPADYKQAIAELLDAINANEITTSELDKRCKTVLSYKYKWLVEPQKTTDIRFGDMVLQAQALLQQSAFESVTLVKNNNNCLPIALSNDTLAIISINGNDDSDLFIQTISDFQPVKVITDTSNLRLQEQNIIIAVHGSFISKKNNYNVSPNIITLAGKIKNSRNRLILAYFGNPYALNAFAGEWLKLFDAVTVGYEDNLEAELAMANGILGGIGFNGELPVSCGPFLAGTGFETHENQVPFTNTAFEGFNQNMTSRIDSLMNSAIKNRATPGCQVAIVRNGHIALAKSYGTTTYENKQKVQNNFLYDVASVTKAMVTTPLVMNAIAHGKLSLTDTLGRFLPFEPGNKKSSITISQLLLHEAGLPAFIPFYQALYDTNNGRNAIFKTKASKTYNIKIGDNMYASSTMAFKKQYISTTYKKGFDVKLASGMYLSNTFKDTIWAMMDRCKTSDKNKYLYSDLSFIYLQRVLESVYQKPLDSLAQNFLFEPLAMQNSCFKPLEKFPLKILVPTENDKIFRKTCLQGEVHDPTAAVLGGVAGNAGMFSNAIDLAKELSMMMQTGKINQQQILPHDLVDGFITKQNNHSRRGLGFDKPDSTKQFGSPVPAVVPANSFGHLGFTGTIVWADVQTKTGVVFLSNRVYPDAANHTLQKSDIRGKLLEIVYSSIVK